MLVACFLIALVALTLWTERRRQKTKALRIYNHVSAQAEHGLTSYAIMLLISTYAPTLSIRVIGEQLIVLDVWSHDSIFLKEDEQSHLWRILCERS